MSKIKTAFTLLLKDRSIFLSAILKLVPGLFSDKQYISLQYKLRMGRDIDWKCPKTFTEKIQWLKLYNRKQKYSVMVDKYAVKDYVRDLIGDKYIIPTLGVWDSVDDINFDLLPDKFVLKTTHGGGGAGVIICKDKASLDIVNVKNRLNKSMKQKIYKYNREWPYKNVKPRIIAEQYLEDNCGSGNLIDYKFFCFNGKVRFFKIDLGRFIDHRANYYSPDCELLPFGEMVYPPNPEVSVQIPNNLDKMIELAEKLAKGIPFLRADFYNVNGCIYFGELTFYPAGGFGRFTPDEWDKTIGNMLTLPNK